MTTTTTSASPIISRSVIAKGPDVVNFDVLDHSIWNALTSAHRTLARGSGRARRYSSEVSPLAALREPTPQAFADLVTLVNMNDEVALFTTSPVSIPKGWRIVKERLIDQMVCTQPVAAPPTGDILRLGEPDIPDMLALTAATKPGPFLSRTIDMGHYFGIRSKDGRLMAMAGERQKLTHFTEVSAVCTDPDFRGQGHGRAVVAHVVRHILEEGKTPFLHVKGENDSAKTLYEQLGFKVRRAIQFTVIARA